MKNSTLGKIVTQKSGYKTSKFNLSHDVNTTCGWTDVQPLMVRAMEPDSSADVSVESLVRLAPMVAPTFGDVRFKLWHEFVSMSDLTKNFDALMSQTRVNRGGVSFSPSALPMADLFTLSCMCLIGSHCTIYEAKQTTSSNPLNAGSQFKTYNTVQGMTTLFQRLVADYNLTSASSSSTTLDGVVSDALFTSLSAFYGSSDCFQFNPLMLLPEWYIASSSAPSFTSNLAMIPVNRGRASLNKYLSFGLSTLDSYQDVTLEAADVVVMRSFKASDVETSDTNTYAFAFRLSDFGKRIRKALIGAGYQVNFDEVGTYVSLMPLFAVHKAWYELFGLQLFENYEDTSANKILQSYDNTNYFRWSLVDCWDLQDSDNLYRVDTLYKFFVELASMWFTEKTDFVNAHTASITPNVKRVDGMIGSYTMPAFLDVSGTSDSFVDAGSNLMGPASAPVDGTEGVNAHWRTKTQFHGQLDHELLMRLYKWTNIHSVVGQRVRELLIQEGLQDYVDSCQPRFIGYEDTHINVSDVIAKSDTFNASTDDGKILGEFGAFGLQYANGKKFHYETREYGWWITLCAVTPNSGYAQALDGNVLSVDKASFYTPLQDGLGDEANPKLLVCADSAISAPKTAASDRLSSNFGFVPRLSRLKVASNKMNGDFNLRSVRSNYTPFTLDRIFNINDFFARTTETENTRFTSIVQRFGIQDFPIAGNLWRYLGRYGFMSNFKRIFSTVGQPGWQYDSERQTTDLSTEITACNVDGFMVHNSVHMDYYAHMLPIEESFETLDEGNEGSKNSAVEKA